MATNTISKINIQTLDDVENWINSSFNQFQNILPQTKEILEPLSTKDRVLQILSSLLQDNKRLEEIAKRSYLHFNGFDKIVLLESEEFGYRLRLHLWRPEHFIEHFEHVHNHPWDFSSRILAGSLKFQIYSADSSSIEGLDTYYKYVTLPPLEKGNGHILDPKGESNLKLVFDATVKEGSFYSNSRELIHRVIKDNNEFCATLILQSPINGVISDLYTNEPYTNENTSVSHKFYDTDFLKYLLQYMINRL